MSATAPLPALAGSVLERLRRHDLRVAAAESCTGGELLATLTVAPGASDVVWGGAVVYSAASKSLLADVDAALVAREGVVSAAVTRALAEGIRSRAEVEVGLAVTGWAGPESDGPDPVGTVYLGIAAPAVTRVLRMEIPGSRDQVRAGAVRALLEMVLDVVEAGDPGADEGRE